MYADRWRIEHLCRVDAFLCEHAADSLAAHRRMDCEPAKSGPTLGQAKTLGTGVGIEGCGARDPTIEIGDEHIGLVPAIGELAQVAHVSIEDCRRNLVTILGERCHKHPLDLRDLMLGPGADQAGGMPAGM